MYNIFIYNIHICLCTFYFKVLVLKWLIRAVLLDVQLDLLKGALLQFLPPPFFMIDYDREFHADSEKYKNIALKINGKCSNSTSKF